MPGAARRLIVAVALVVGCGGRAPAVIVPPRAVTAGDALLARLPAGADVVLEVDLARLRANPAVGALVTGLVAPAAGGARPELAAVTDAPLAGARAMVLAAYAVGTPAATTVTIVAGGEAPAGALALGDGVWALAPEGDVARLLAVAGGAPSLAGDRALLAVRTRAMPAAAEGAAARLTARLDGPARRALAELLGRADAPAAVSAWLDVADDLALVTWVAGEPATWARALAGLRAAAARLSAVGALGLGPALTQAAIAREPGGARLTVVVSPGRLGRVVGRAQAWLEAGAPAGGQVGSPP